MAVKASNKLSEHTISVNGIEITVQLTDDEADAMQAAKGKADVDKTATVHVASIVAGDDGSRGTDDNPFDDVAKAPVKATGK